MPSDKAAIRAEMRRLTREMTDEERRRQSLSVWQQIESLPVFRQAATVLLYWSMPDEVDTHEWLMRWSRHKTVLLPVVEGENLLLKRFTDEASLQTNGQLPVYEPQGAAVPLSTPIDIAIIPGLAFDAEGHRLGRGKGYYDRLLAQIHPYTIGVCFACQLLPQVLADKHDMDVDTVITYRTKP